ncbi:MAG: hypothetical protein AAGF53_18970 [Pseudomonadota bacterium]
MRDELDFEARVLVAADGARREGFTQTYKALLEVARLLQLDAKDPFAALKNRMYSESNTAGAEMSRDDK